MSRKMTKEEYFEREKKSVGTSTLDFTGPVLTGGEGVTAYDLDGSPILDFTSQISLLNTGYVPKEVVSAIRQMSRKIHANISADWPYCVEIKINGRKTEISRAALAERLIRITEDAMPLTERRVHFEVSGATAVNAALKIAKITFLRKRQKEAKDVAGKNFEEAWLDSRLRNIFEKDIFIPSQEELCRFSFLVCRNAFHGRHGDTQCATNSKVKQLWAASSSCAFGRLPFPALEPSWEYTWEYIFKKTKKIIAELEKFAPVIAFLFEPVQGEGGINIPDAHLLKNLVEYLRGRGIYIIADEVQTGLGRTGKMWACEHFDIRPDMIITSKSLGAGIPIGAVIVDADKFPDLEPGMHSGSHHAAALATAGAIANIDLILREDLVGRSYNYGALSLYKLKEIRALYPKEIEDIRGLGLMIGIKFRSVEARDKVVQECKKNGLLLASAGARAIRMTPPLIVNLGEIHRAMFILENTLKSLK